MTYDNWLKDFLPERKTVLIALVTQRFRQLRRSTVEHRHLAFLLLLHLLEHFVPIRSASVRACFQAGNQISFFLLA